MKKMFFYASLLLAAATLNSCSQDSDLAADEAATAAASALTPEQRAQIMELADKYGLNIEVLPQSVKRSGRNVNIDSLEQEFQQMAALQGKYEFSELRDSSVAIYKKGKGNVRRLRASMFTPETSGGEFEKFQFVDGSSYMVSVSWTYNGRGGGSVSVGLEPLSYNPLLAGCDFEQRGMQYQFIGIGENFNFSCEIWARKKSGIVVYKFYVYGDYSGGTGNAYLTTK